jgi:arylsulfatase A-like enzyme
MRIRCDEPDGSGRAEASERPRLAPGDALLLAAWFGLAGGLLDLGVMTFNKTFVYQYRYFVMGRYFPWVVPVANLGVVMVPGLALAVASRLRPSLVPLGAAVWLLAMVALWEPLLRLPLFGWASLLLGAGLGRGISRAVLARAPGFRWFVRRSLVGLVGLVAVLAAMTSGRAAWAEHCARASLPPPPARASNAILIVLDTVRADHLSLHGYARNTTPNLERWARRGVRFDGAMAPASWTYPSHSCFLTGQWPYKIDSQWNHVLDTPYPTLAEYLAARGFETAGFVANTNYCSYETGLNRGFTHFEDYPLTPRTLFGSIKIGRWLLEHVLYPDDAYHLKWIRAQSRDACAINRDFLAWLSQRRGSNRPFFAFLNYFDAHEPYVLPVGHADHFGLRPESPVDDQVLLTYKRRDKRTIPPRHVALARDAYDDCIAYLDRQVGALLDELERRGVLRETAVIITSDHGEHFGDHGLFDHGKDLYSSVVHVPLVILTRESAPAGRVVSEAVSLRDLPATIVDLVGQSAGSPFPGGSLAALWRSSAGSDPGAVTPGVSEAIVPSEFSPEYGLGPIHKGFVMSLVVGDLHYIRDDSGFEELYHLDRDPGEQTNLAGVPGLDPTLNRFRRSLVRVLAAEPAKAGIEGDYVRKYREHLEALLGEDRLALGRSRPGTPPRGGP